MYTLETHSHTSAVSPCGTTGPEETIELYLRAEFDGMIITDHFSDYNPIFTGVLPWKRKVDLFWTGFEEMLELGDRAGLDIFPGIELTFRGDPNDYLVYGLSRNWMYGHSAFHHWNLEAFAANIDRDSTLIVQAHPFRFGMFPRKSPFVDGVEVFNGNARHDSRNDEALEWSREHRLPGTSGSDFHKPEDCARGGMVFNRPIGDIQDFIERVKTAEFSLIRGSESSCVLC